MRAFEAIILKTAILGLCSSSVAHALPPVPLPQSVTSTRLTQAIRVPAGTVVELEFVDALSSKTSTTGQTFVLRVRQPIVIDGQNVIPAGIMGGGEVIDAAKAGMGGRSGKLILSGRFLEIQGQRVRIRGLQSVLAGTDRSRTAVNTVILIPYVGFLGGFVQGGDIEVTSGTVVTAQLATDLIVSPPFQSNQSVIPVAPSSSSTTPTSEGN